MGRTEPEVDEAALSDFRAALREVLPERPTAAVDQPELALTELPPALVDAIREVVEESLSGLVDRRVAEALDARLRRPLRAGGANLEVVN